MPDAAAEILARTATLSGLDIARLATAAATATGYLGIRSSWIEARNAAVDAGRSAGLGPTLDRAPRDALNAVMTAAVSVSAARYKHPERVHEAARAYRASGGVWYRGEHHREARQLRKVLRMGLGPRTEHGIGLVIDGVEAAVIAALTWSLARERGGYTLRHRQLLTKPWTAVAPLPRELT